MQLLVTRTYDTVIMDDADNCDPSETGELFRDEPMDVRDVISGLETDQELSRYPIRSAKDAAGTWTISRETINPQGDETTYHRHIRHLDGRPLSGAQLFRLYRAARLV